MFTVQYAGRWYEWRPHWFHIPPTIMEEDDGGSHYHSLSLSFTRSLDYCQRKKVNVVKPEKLDVLWRSWFARAAAAVWGEHFVWHANDNLLWQLLGYLIHSTTPPPLSLYCSLVFTIVFFVLSCFSTKSILVLVLHRGPNHLLMMLLYRY